jgi:hypothetical protein
MQNNRRYDSYMRYYHYPSSYPTEELAHHPRERDNKRDNVEEDPTLYMRAHGTELSFHYTTTS